jgi:hypothetical protein
LFKGGAAILADSQNGDIIVLSIVIHINQIIIMISKPDSSAKEVKI